VIAIGPVAAMLCGASLFAWALYPEGALLKAAAAREGGPEVQA
jgi:hypothetical protein